MDNKNITTIVFFLVLKCFLAFIKVMTILQELKINMFAKIKSHHNNKTLIYSIQMSWCSTITSFNNIQIAYRNFALKFKK